MKKLAILGLSALLAACGGGGGSSGPASSTVSVAPSLGKFSAGAVVTIKSPAGSTLGTGTTGSNGTASVNIGTYSGPLVIEVKGASGVTYYDEGSKTTLPFGSTDTLSAIAPAVQATIGVTPFTHAAVAAIKAANSGSIPSTISTTTIAVANSKIQAAFGITDVLQAPTLVDGSTGTTLDLANVGDQYALKLAALAKLAATGQTALTVANTLAQDLTDDKLDGNQGTTPLATPAYNPATVTTDWTTQTQSAATDLGTTNTQTLVSSNPAVLGTVTTDVSTVTPPPAGTSTTDVQLAKDMFGELRTTMYAYLNNGKTGFLDNQATRASNDLAANVAPDLTRLQGRLSTLDMGVSTYYAARTHSTSYTLTSGTAPDGVTPALIRAEGSPYNVFYGISGWKRCWTDSGTGVNSQVTCVSAASGNVFMGTDGFPYLRILRQVITWDSATDTYSYAATRISRKFDTTAVPPANPLSATTTYPDPSSPEATGTVKVTQGSTPPAGTIVINGTMPPSTALTGLETVSVNLSNAYTATNRLRMTLTGSVSAPNAADSTKSVSVSIDSGTYFDLDTTNMQTTGPAPVAINFVGTIQTAATKFTGTAALDTFHADVDGLNPMFTHGTFNGSVWDLSTGGAGQFLTGQFTFTTNYASYHSTQPESTTNFLAPTGSFTGTVQAPSRPAMTLTVSGSRTGLNASSGTLNYTYGTISVTGTGSVSNGVWTLSLTNQNSIQVASDTTTPGKLLVTKSGTALATVTNNTIQYVDGVTESLN